MSIFKRAWLYTTRKRKKSLIMMFILFGIATAVLSGVSIKKAAELTKEGVNQTANSSFELQGAGLSNSIVNQIAQVDGVKAYNARLSENGFLEGKLVELKDKTSMVDVDGFENAVIISGNTSSELDPKFISSRIQLVEGRHITKEDRHKALVHKNLAELNGWKLGDKIKVTQNPLDTEVQKGKGGEATLEIVGFFDGEADPNSVYQQELVDNLIISDIETIKDVYGYTEETLSYWSADYFVDEPDQLESVMAAAMKLPIDWNMFSLYSSKDSTYKTLASSVTSLDKIVNMVLIGVIVGSAVLLSLILFFWIQGRMYETGILLSVGVAKRKIIYQYIVELLLIAIISFPLSYLAGNVIAQGIGDTLVEQAGTESKQEFSQSLGGLSFGADPESNVLSQTISSIDVQVSMGDMLYVWIIGALIIIASVTIASISIIRLNPKKILSNMS